MVHHEALRVGFWARCEAGPIKHIQHFGNLGHSDVDADEATKGGISGRTPPPEWEHDSGSQVQEWEEDSQSLPEGTNCNVER